MTAVVVWFLASFLFPFPCRDGFGADELLDFLRVEAAGGGFFEDLAESGADQFGAFDLALATSAGGDGEARAAEGFEDAVVLELAVGAGDRVGVDGEVAGQLADAGNEVAGREGRVGDRELELADDLIVDREAVVGVDLEKHARSPWPCVLSY